MTLLALVKLLPCQTDHTLSIAVLIFQSLEFYFTLRFKHIDGTGSWSNGNMFNSSLPKTWSKTFLLVRFYGRVEVVP